MKSSIFGMTVALTLGLGCEVNPGEPPVPQVIYEHEATNAETDVIDEGLDGSPVVAVDAGSDLEEESSQPHPNVDAGHHAPAIAEDAGVAPVIVEMDAGSSAVVEEGAPADCVALDNASYFAQKVWGEVLSNDCIGCHHSQGLAASSDLVLQSASQLGFMAANLETTTNLALTQYAGTSKLILKPLGELNHGGGAIIDADSEEYLVLSEFVSRIENGVVVCEEGTQDEEGAQQSYVKLRPLKNNLRTVFLDVVGRLPTHHEYLQVRMQGEAGYRSALLNAMQEDSFFVRLKEMYNDLLLTDKYHRGAEALALLNSNIYPARYWYEGVSNNGQRNRLRDYANMAVAQEPLELIAYVVKNDKPFTEILTADYMMINGFSANSYGLQESFNYPVGGDEYDSSYHTYRVYRMEGIPHAGILTTRAFLNRFPTTDTNRNRHRARMFFQHFLATDILSLGERPIDPTATETHNPTLNDPQCTVCHAALDPMAGTFQNWGVNANYEPPELGWFLDMRAPGLSEDAVVPMFDHTASLQWLSQEATVDPRFVWAMVYNTYWMLTGNAPLTPVDQIQDEEALSAFLAYEKQNDYFEQLGAMFEASDYNLKQLFIELTLSEYYRAINLDSDDAELQHEHANLGADQLLTPENLARKIVAVTGYPWRSSRGTRDYMQNEFEMFYGGIDSDGTTTRIREPNGIMANITRRMAMDMQCISVARDFVLAPEHRRFFPFVERDIVPELQNGYVIPQAVEAIKKNIQFLYLQILDEELPLDDIEVEAAYQLWFETWTEGQQKLDEGMLSATLSINCQGARDYVSNDNYPAERRFSTDSNYVVRSWGAVVTFMLGDYSFFME